MTDDRSKLEQIILDLAHAQPPGASFSPSEAAQALDPAAWRSRLSAVKRAALRLAADGRIDILRKGKKVAPDQAVRGVIRLRRASPADNLG